MSWANWKGFNFRETLGHVTDGTNEQAVTLAAHAYPQTTTIGGDSVTWGWEDIAGNTRDRDAGVDRRLAGVHFLSAGNPDIRFRIDLPSAGIYEIRIAQGDATNGNAQRFEVRDGTTVRINGAAEVGTAAGQFIDAKLAVRATAAAWASNQRSSAETFATTIFRLVLRAPSGGSSTIAHIAIRKLDEAVVSQPSILLLFNEASGSVVTNYGSQAGGNYTVQQGASPTDYAWTPQAVRPTGGFLDLKNVGNGSANMPYLTTAATAPSASAGSHSTAVGFRIDGWDTGLTRSYIVGPNGSGIQGPIRLRVLPPSGGGNFDLSIQVLTSGGFGPAGASAGMTGLTFGTFYQVSAAARIVAGTVELRYLLGAGSVQALTPTSSGADSWSAHWPLLNGAINEGFTNFGAIDGQIFYFAHDRDGLFWSDAEMAAINANPAAALTGWPQALNPLRRLRGARGALSGNSGRRLAV